MKAGNPALHEGKYNMSTRLCRGRYIGFKITRNLCIHQTAQHARKRKALVHLWCEQKLAVTLGHGAMSALCFFSQQLDEGTWRSSDNARADRAWLEHQVQDLLS